AYLTQVSPAVASLLPGAHPLVAGAGESGVPDGGGADAVGECTAEHSASTAIVIGDDQVIDQVSGRARRDDPGGEGHRRWRRGSRSVCIVTSGLAGEGVRMRRPARTSTTKSTIRGRAYLCIALDCLSKSSELLCCSL